MERYKKKYGENLRLPFRRLLHLLYPPRCPFCDRIIVHSLFMDTPDICGQCIGKPEYAVEPLCKKCGKPISDERLEYCYDCRKMPHAFEQGKSLYLYKGAVKESIYRFKYGNRREYAVYYGHEIVRRYGAWIRNQNIEAIIPIPLHQKRKRQRGFNQAELLAREIGRSMEIPVYTDLLKRIKNTKPQKQLNDAERKNNLKKAFKISPNKVQLNHILLVDDIYTTGSTIDGAAKELIRGGTTCVYYVGISIGRGFEEEVLWR
ncbi:ComF family protein [Lachnospiraceae bacterium ZAX-1]